MRADRAHLTAHQARQGIEQDSGKDRNRGAEQQRLASFDADQCACGDRRARLHEVSGVKSSQASYCIFIRKPEANPQAIRRERNLMDLKIPQPLKAEHAELHDELKRATSAGGRTAEAAREVARLLHPHFVKEEEFALPSLGLLVHVARGETLPSDLAELAIGMAERLKMELPEMLAEHGQIVAALDALAAAAKEEGRAEIAQFAEKLKQHAKTEEEVLYPAAIVLGEHLAAAGRAR